MDLSLPGGGAPSLADSSLEILGEGEGVVSGELLLSFM